MIILKTAHQSFTLDIIERESPNATSSEDQQWLNIQIQVSNRNYNWQARDPCMRISELIVLGEWIHSLRKNKESTSIRFLEPALEFQYDNITNTLLIALNYELHPQYPNHYDWRSREPYTLSFALDHSLLAHIQEQLDKYLEKYSRG